MVDALGVDEFGVVGLSGGGPYALAIGARAAATACTGSPCWAAWCRPSDPRPASAGPAARPGPAGPARSCPRSWTVGGVGLWALLRVTRPLGYTLYDRVTPLLRRGDQEVFASEGMREMFIGDLQNGGRKQFRAALHDAALFGRDWGFRLADVSVPVRWWHGDIDPIVPLSAAEAAYPHLPDVEFHLRPGESHLGGFAAAHEVLEALAELRPDHGPTQRPVRTATDDRSVA